MTAGEITPELIESFLATHRRRVIEAHSLIRAGVLFLLVGRESGVHVLLTKRTDDVEHHKGQISFPGGAADPADRDIVVTALREAEEEIGLRRDVLRILGLFDDYETPSGFVVTPVIAFAESLPELAPSKDEVAEILEVPISLFLDRTNERVERRVKKGRGTDVYFYSYGRHEVWGATAAMIRSFLDTLTSHRAGRPPEVR